MSDKKQDEQEHKAGLGGSAVRPAPGETAKVLDPPPPDPPSSDDDSPEAGAGLPHGSPDGLKEAAAGSIDEGNGSDAARAEAAVKEKDALDFMLSNPSPAPFTVEVMVDTPEGLRKLVFHMHQLDGARIEALETEHTEGVGPFSKVDRLRLNAAKVAEATDRMVGHTGKELTPTDGDFLRDAVSPAIAFERMFRFQPGVGDQVAEQIDRMAGMSRDRVGMAEREMTTAVGNS